MRTRHQSFYTFLFLAVTVIACNVNELEFDNIQTPNYRPDVAAPIGEVTYTVSELIDELEDSTVAVEQSNSNLISVVYRDTSRFANNNDFVLVSDVTNASNIMPGITLPASPIDTAVSISQSFEFEFQPEDQEKVDSVFYSSGTIELVVNSSFTSDVLFELKITDFTNVSTGDTLTFNGTINASGSINLTQDLTGWMTRFNRIGDINIFTANFTGTIDVKTGQSVDASQALTFQLLITSPMFSSVFGDFGNQVVSIQDQTIDLEFFRDINEFGLAFNQPEVNIRIENSFGIPMGLSFQGLTSSNDNGTTVSLMGSINDTLQRVRAPEVVGQSLGTTITINNDNSNLRDLLNISPTRITVPVSAKPNFEANGTDPISNFLTDSSFVETIVEVNMPLDVRLSGFTRTFDFSIDDIDFDDADTITLRVQTINDLPFNGSIELHMIDADSMVIYQVPQTILLQSPDVGADGRTVGSLHNTSDIVLDSDGINAFVTATTLGVILRVDSFDASNGSFIEIYSDYKLVIKIAALADLNVEL